MPELLFQSPGSSAGVAGFVSLRRQRSLYPLIVAAVPPLLLGAAQLTTNFVLSAGTALAVTAVGEPGYPHVVKVLLAEETSVPYQVLKIAPSAL